KLKSSSGPIRPRDLWSCPNAGSSSAPSLGSIGAAGLPRTGRTSIEKRWHSCTSPHSASCSEDFVIPHEVIGQTLRRGNQPPALSLKSKSLRKLRERGEMLFPTSQSSA